MILIDQKIEKIFDYIKDVNRKVDELRVRSVQQFGDRQIEILNAEDLMSIDGSQLRRRLGIGKDTWTKLKKEGTLNPLPLVHGMHEKYNLLQVAHDLQLPLIYLKILAAQKDKDYFENHVETFQKDYFQNRGIKAAHMGQLKFWIDNEWKKEQRGEKSLLMPLFRKELGKYFK